MRKGNAITLPLNDASSDRIRNLGPMNGARPIPARNTLPAVAKVRWILHLRARRQRLTRKQPQGEQQHVTAVECTPEPSTTPPRLLGVDLLFSLAPPPGYSRSSLWLTMFAGLLLCLIFAKLYRPRPHEGRMEADARAAVGPPDRRRE